MNYERLGLKEKKQNPVLVSINPENGNDTQLNPPVLKTELPGPEAELFRFSFNDEDMRERYRI